MTRTRRLALATALLDLHEQLVARHVPPEAIALAAEIEPAITAAIKRSRRGGVQTRTAGT